MLFVCTLSCCSLKHCTDHIWDKNKMVDLAIHSFHQRVSNANATCNLLPHQVWHVPIRGSEGTFISLFPARVKSPDPPDFLYSFFIRWGRANEIGNVLPIIKRSNSLNFKAEWTTINVSFEVHWSYVLKEKSQKTFLVPRRNRTREKLRSTLHA